MSEAEKYTEKRVLTGFAIAYRFEDHGFNEAGKCIYVHSAILLGPRMIQANSLPTELQDAIESFLEAHMETIDE